MREKLKSLALVLLIMLLFFNLFLYTSFIQPGGESSGPIEITAESLSSLISPFSASYQDERGLHFKSALGPEELSAASRIMAKSLNELMIGPHALLSEGYEKKYETNSLSLSLGLGLDIKALISLVVENPEHSALQNLKLKGRLEELILPLDLKTLVFKIEGLYYEVPLLSELRADVEEIKEAIVKSSSVKYAYSRVLNGPEPVLLPIGGYLAPPKYSLSPKTEFSDAELDSLSRKVFGAGSDFLKGALTSDGSLILVYGYGDEILSVDKKGIIQYKNNQSSGPKTDSLRSALSTALSFIIRLNGEHHGYRLAALSYNDEEDSYRFSFTGLKLDLPLLVTEDGYDLAIEVRSGQILTYRQSYYELKMEEGDYQTGGIDFSPRVVSSLLKEGDIAAEIAELGSLKELSLSYLKTKTRVLPVIVISGERGRLELDYYTGAIR